jgi:hypothetical protein
MLIPIVKHGHGVPEKCKDSADVFCMQQLKTQPGKAIKAALGTILVQPSGIRVEKVQNSSGRVKKLIIAHDAQQRRGETERGR